MPMRCPSLDLWTVVILSIMMLLAAVKPLVWLGCNGIRSSGVSALAVVSGQRVIESVPSNLSSWMIRGVA